MLNYHSQHEYEGSNYLGRVISTVDADNEIYNHHAHVRCLEEMNKHQFMSHDDAISLASHSMTFESANHFKC